MDNVIQNQNINQTPQTAKLKKCVSCGADLVFDGKTNTLYCEHCDGRYSVPDVPFREKKFFNPKQLDDEVIQKETLVTRCLNCGANVTINSTSMSHICPFCSSSKITTNTKLDYLPDAILPFTIGKEEVSIIFKKWVKKRKMAPKSFKRVDSTNELKPIYAPCWLFDTKSRTDYSGYLAYNRTETYKDSEGRTQTRTVTDYKYVSGCRDDVFTNLTVHAGESMSKGFFNKIEPFNLANIKVFSEEYLAGYYTNQYSLNLKNSWQMTESNVRSMIIDKIISYHGADGYRSLDLDLHFDYTKYAYAFLPVWVGSYIYENKNYNVYINGSTGEIAGKSPISKFKVFMIILSVLLLVGGAVLLHLYLNGGL